MKFKINWNSPTQGTQSTTVDAINTFAAQEQFDSMYGGISGLNVISISPIFDKEEYSESEQFYSSESSGGESSDSLSSVIGGGAITLGIVVAFAGLFFLPVGILAMIVGGAIGWLGMQLGFWLSDRGW